MTFVGFGSIKRSTEPSIDRKTGANYRPIDGSLSFFLIVSHDNNDQRPISLEGELGNAVLTVL
jgi:hypothetical protein